MFRSLVEGCVCSQLCLNNGPTVYVFIFSLLPAGFIVKADMIWSWSITKMCMNSEVTVTGVCPKECVVE